MMIPSSNTSVVLGPASCCNHTELLDNVSVVPFIPLPPLPYDRNFRPDREGNDKVQ